MIRFLLAAVAVVAIVRDGGARIEKRTLERVDIDAPSVDTSRLQPGTIGIC